MIVDNGLELLTETECFDLLSREHVGRVAVTVGALPAIFPVNYALMDRSIVFLTGEGTKLRAALERTVVAFEIDALDALSHGGWSVMMVGVAAPLDDGDLERAHGLPLRPWVDGERHHYVGIVPELVSGRRIRHLANAVTHVPAEVGASSTSCKGPRRPAPLRRRATEGRGASQEP